MFRIILTLGFTLLFAYAQTCDFSNLTQDECEIDIENPPLMLHKFVKDDGSEFSELYKCVKGEDTEFDEVSYAVLDCSMVESKSGNLTEGVTLSNGKNLIKSKVVTFKQDNVLLRVAGDFVLDSGIRLNQKNPKNLILEVIEGSNTKSNMILQRGASIKANAIIMPEGANSSIFVNTFYGGIYEKEFIDLINQKTSDLRGGMETLLNVDDILGLSGDAGEIVDFNGGVFCGPEVNPLDLENTNYTLKRLFRVKNTSIDKPSANNAICGVKDGDCFANIIDFSNKKFAGKSYKIASSKMEIIPTYDIFIESGKIISSDGRAIKDIAPSATIAGQNNGSCEKPVKVAFDKNVVDAYLAEVEAKKAETAKADAEKQTIADSVVDSALDSAPQIAESAKSQNLAQKDENLQNKDEEQAGARLNAELDENLQDLLTKFNKDKIAESSADSAKKAQNQAKSALDSATKADSAPSATQNAESADLEILKNALIEKRRLEDLKIKDEFLIVERVAYESANKSCYGDLRCIYSELSPIDGLIWNKKSSKNITHSIYAVNVTNDDLALTCEVQNHYGKTFKKSFNLNSANIIGVIDLKFPSSNDTTQITCRAAKQAKSTNKIVVTPASFDINYAFEGSDGKASILKAGDIKIGFDEGKALTMESEVDYGFSGDLVVKSTEFKQKQYCKNSGKAVISAPKDLKLEFKNGYLRSAFMNIIAKTIAFGDLKIELAIPNNDKTCITQRANNSLMPLCTSTILSKEVSIIPANFMVATDIVSESSKIAYYGQIDDKITFKHNPRLSLRIQPLNSAGQPVEFDKTCAYGSVELSLKSDKLIEFKRTSSDRLNSKITAYLSDFDTPSGTEIKTYFGISKMLDSYKNTRKITQSDLLEPLEITLFDFNFNIRFKDSKTQFLYDNPIVYDNLDDDSNPASILIARGKLQVNDIKGNVLEPANLVAKYAIYCKTCDRVLLAKYLQQEPEVESQYWYINNQHPSAIYIADRHITKLNLFEKNADLISIKNSNNAFEGRQKITFSSEQSGSYDIAFDQRTGEFAPYLNYSQKQQKGYVPNNFSVMIGAVDASILDEIEQLKKDAESAKKAAEEEAQKAQKAAEKAQKPVAKPAPKPATPAKPAPKPAKNDEMKLDIED